MRCAPPIPEATRLHGHVVASLETWLARIEGREVKTGAWWPDAALGDLAARRLLTVRAWRKFAAGLDAATLAREVRFTNSAGVDCHDPIEAIVRHVVNHSTHHRAQIASLMRAAGQKPPVLDYIVWRRELGERSTL